PPALVKCNRSARLQGVEPIRRRKVWNQTVAMACSRNREKIRDFVEGAEEGHRMAFSLWVRLALPVALDEVRSREVNLPPSRVREGQCVNYRQCILRERRPLALRGCGLRPGQGRLRLPLR